MTTTLASKTSLFIRGDPQRAVFEAVKRRNHAVEGKLRLEWRNLLHQTVDKALR